MGGTRPDEGPGSPDDERCHDERRHHQLGAVDEQDRAAVGPGTPEEEPAEHGDGGQPQDQPAHRIARPCSGAAGGQPEQHERDGEGDHGGGGPARFEEQSQGGRLAERAVDRGHPAVGERDDAGAGRGGGAAQRHGHPQGDPHDGRLHHHDPPPRADRPAVQGRDGVPSVDRAERGEHDEQRHLGQHQGPYVVRQAAASAPSRHHADSRPLAVTRRSAVRASPENRPTAVASPRARPSRPNRRAPRPRAPRRGRARRCRRSPPRAAPPWRRDRSSTSAAPRGGPRRAGRGGHPVSGPPGILWRRG